MRAVTDTGSQDTAAREARHPRRPIGQFREILNDLREEPCRLRPPGSASHQPELSDGGTVGTLSVQLPDTSSDSRGHSPSLGAGNWASFSVIAARTAATPVS